MKFCVTLLYLIFTQQLLEETKEKSFVHIYQPLSKTFQLTYTHIYQLNYCSSKLFV